MHVTDALNMGSICVADGKTRIIVVGGGAGGLELVTKLGAAFGRESFDIVLVDRNNTHIWKPLLHEVAAGSLDAGLDEVEYQSHGHRWMYRFINGELEGIDRGTRTISIAPVCDSTGRQIMAGYRIQYHYLVLSLGSVSNDFGTPGVSDYCLFLDSRIQADDFRQKLLTRWRCGSQDPGIGSTHPTKVRISIVGGGATGVELAAELASAGAAISRYDFRASVADRLAVTLIEAGPRILPSLPKSLSEAAHTELGVLGVRVLTGTAITRATATGMITASDEMIEADLQVWAAGVKGPEVLKNIGGLETTPNKQLVVRPTLQTSLDDRIFAIGDCCYCVCEGATRAVPPRAQAAHQMASATFLNLRRALLNEPLKPFHYRDRGSLISLSRYSTVGSLMGNLIGGRMAIEGRLARLVYNSLYRVHLIKIHGLLRGLAIIMLSRVNQIVRPKLKLH